MNKENFIIVVLLILVTLGCSSVNTQYGPKPAALGKMNEIVVIADKELWEGMVGDTFKYYFGSAYPIMPSPEPIFDIRHFTPEQISEEPLRKELRTYVLLGDLSDKQSAGSAMIAGDLGQEKYNEALSNNNFNSMAGRDKWAAGQVLFYLFGNDKDAISRTIRERFSTISNKVNQHDGRQLGALTYAGSSLTGFEEKLLDKYGFKLQLPGNYKMIEEEEELSWFRKDDREFVLNLVFDKVKYERKDQLSKDAVIDWANTYGTRFKFTETEGSILRINNEDLPVLEYNTEIDGSYTTELRGIWEMDKDFLGGPFFAYAMLNKDQTEVIYSFAYVSAPGQPKRDKMMQLEFLVNSIKW